MVSGSENLCRVGFCVFIWMAATNHPFKEVLLLHRWLRLTWSGFHACTKTVNPNIEVDWLFLPFFRLLLHPQMKGWRAQINYFLLVIIEIIYLGLRAFNSDTVRWEGVSMSDTLKEVFIGYRSKTWIIQNGEKTL